MRDERLEEMVKRGMRPHTTMLLTVMRWPDPFTTLPWAEAPEPEPRSLYDVLAEPVTFRISPWAPVRSVDLT